VLDVPLEEILAQSGSGSRLSGEVKSLLDPTEVTSMPGKVTSLLPPPIPDAVVAGELLEWLLEPPPARSEKKELPNMPPEDEELVCSWCRPPKDDLMFGGWLVAGAEPGETFDLGPALVGVGRLRVAAPACNAGLRMPPLPPETPIPSIPQGELDLC